MFRTIRKIALTVVAAAAALTFIVPTPAAIAGGGNNEIRVQARLSGKSLASGKAVYRDRIRNSTIEQRFKIQVEDATPGATLEVAVNGVPFGQIIVNGLGGGELEFRTAQFIDDPGDGSPIPTDFPRLMAGDTVTVGAMSGTFN